MRASQLCRLRASCLPQLERTADSTAARTAFGSTRALARTPALASLGLGGFRLARSRYATADRYAPAALRGSSLKRVHAPTLVAKLAEQARRPEVAVAAAAGARPPHRRPSPADARRQGEEDNKK